MLVRFISISILKWVVSYLVVLLALEFILPDDLAVLWRNMAIWAVTTPIALLFAEWAMKTKMPEKKDVTILVVTWLIVSSVLLTGVDIITWGQPFSLLYDWNIKIQYALELAMVLVAAWLSRKRRHAHAASEGMEV